MTHMDLGFGLPAGASMESGSFNLTLEPLGPAWRALGSVAQVREDLGRYAEAVVTQSFLEPNFQPGGPDLARILAQM